MGYPTRDEKDLIRNYNELCESFKETPPALETQLLLDAKIFKRHYLNRSGSGLKDGVSLSLASEAYFQLAGKISAAKYAIEAHETAKRSRGGKGRKKLAEAEHKQWLIEELEEFKGHNDIFQKIAKAISEKHLDNKNRPYKVSAKTVGLRIKELNLLEDA